MGVVIVLDCNDLEREATFWAGALAYRRSSYAEPYLVLVPAEGGSGPDVVLQRVPEPKTVKNRMHIDLHVENLETEADRVTALGATRISTEPVEEYGFRWLVMASPDHNEFCICQPPSEASTRSPGSGID